MKGSYLLLPLALALSSYTAAANAIDAPTITSFDEFSPCYNSYRLKWTSVTGASYYELWASYYGGASGTWSIYNAYTTTAAKVTLDTGATGGAYFVVRACDATSCSDDSASVYLMTYSGCD